MDPNQENEALARFRLALQAFSSLPDDAKHERLRKIGILSKDNRLTKRFGGEGELDEESVQAHQRATDERMKAHHTSAPL